MIGISILFFLSGLAALIYEIVWFRQLGLIFGNTVYAATAVLTAYMLGLACGSYIFGRLSDRFKSPVRIYGLLEAGVGLYALMVPLLFQLVSLVHQWAFRSVSDDAKILTTIIFVLSVLVLLIPTLLMGASLPVLTCGLLRKSSDFGRRLSVLYGINTLGAVTGVFAAGFVLIPRFGVSTTLWIAVGVNLLVGLIAMSPKMQAPPSGAQEPADQQEAVINRKAVLILAAIFLSGFLSLAFEVVWFRALILIFGSTTYSFTVMLGIFLLGIALGSFILGRYADHMHRILFILAATEACVCVYTLCSLYFFDDMPSILLNILAERNFSWSGILAGKLLVSMIFLLIPAFLFGIDIPLTARALRESTPSSSETVGGIYAANTVGSVLGSILGGFLLLPVLGVLNSLILLSLLTGGLAVYMAFLTAHRRFIAGMALLTLVCAVFVSVRPPVWSEKLLTLGPYFQPMRFLTNGKADLSSKLAEMRLDYFREGVVATIGVVRSDDERLQYINTGKIEADSSMRSMTLQRMQAHMPMLFHPAPHKVLNIGLGAGVTFGALGCYPVERLDVVELEPQVREVARIFAPFNHDIISNPQANIIINDGRNYLRCTTNLYDVITSDPFEPVFSGANNLYTVDHFKTVKSRLRDGGIMGQYLPLYELSAEDYMTILRSFVSVFPQSLLFYTGDDTILLGFKDEMNLDADFLSAKFSAPAVSSSLKEIGINSAEQVLGMFVADLTTRPELGRGRLNTDDRPFVEFSAPKIALKVLTDSNQSELLSVFTDVPAPLLDGLSDAQRSKIKDSRGALKLAMKANVARARGNASESIKMLEAAYRRSDRNSVIMNRLADVLMRRADMHRQAGNMPLALRDFKRVLELRPDEFWALFFVSNDYLQAGNFPYADMLIRRAESRYPESAIIVALRAYYEFKRGNSARAIELMDQAVAMRPDRQSIWHQYGLMADLMGEPEIAAMAREQEKKLSKSR